MRQRWTSRTVPARPLEVFDGEPSRGGESVEVMREPNRLLAVEIGQSLVTRFRGVIDELSAHDVGHEAAHDG